MPPRRPIRNDAGLRALGTAVFFGMLGVTFFGLLFTPVFFVLVRWLGTLRGRDPI